MMADQEHMIHSIMGPMEEQMKQAMSLLDVKNLTHDESMTQMKQEASKTARGQSFLKAVEKHTARATGTSA
jgi:hypothetical protein